MFISSCYVKTKFLPGNSSCPGPGRGEVAVDVKVLVAAGGGWGCRLSVLPSPETLDGCLYEYFEQVKIFFYENIGGRGYISVEEHVT